MKRSAMNSRRKFLLQGGMATTALLVAKPFQTIAESGIPLGASTRNNNKITFLHTGYQASLSADQLLQEINAHKHHSNVVLMDAADATANHPVKLPYDASISRNNPVSGTANNFRIIYKGNIKIGVISATAADTDVIGHINKLSAYLKKEKNCHIVVCLSQLGYKNNHKVDDRTLAAASTSLDMIIGGNATNHSKKPVVLLNKDNAEVVISHSPGNDLPLSQVDIAFNKQGKKSHIAFNHVFQS